MHIDEFVQIYTPLELEKVEIKRNRDYTRETTIVGKLASSVVGERTKGKREMSPQRASKIIKDVLTSGKTKFATFFAVPRKKPPSPSPKRMKSRSSTDQWQ
mmetsp:Transcript_10704/g.20824  ORF Transcript_10704/g.20824 Transcript_10704/m.20824 type:complete len:101 (-) Transcript_10704:342-644(-)